MWVLKDVEFRALLKARDVVRYEYSVKRIADTELLWSLRNEKGWVLYGTLGNDEAVPVWPHEAYAKACAEGPWEGYVPESISMEQWFNKWTPGMTKDERLVAVFPVSRDGKCVVVKPERFARDLEEELEKFG